MRSNSNFLALRSWEGSWKKVDRGWTCVYIWKNCDMLLFLQTLYLIIFSPCYVFMFLPGEPFVEKILKKYRCGCSDAHTSIDYRRCETTRKSRKTIILESSRRSNVTRQAMSLVNKSTWLSFWTYVVLYILAIRPNNVRKISLKFDSCLVNRI